MERICADGQHEGRDAAEAQLSAALWWADPGMLRSFLGTPFDQPADCFLMKIQVIDMA